MSIELKAVPAVIRRDAGHVNLEGKPMMSVTFYLPADRLQVLLGVGLRECTIVVPEANPVRPCDCVNAPEGSPDCRYCGTVKP